MRFKAKPWELVFDLLSKWIVGRDFKGKLEAQGKELQEERIQRIVRESVLESRLSALGAEIMGKKIEAQEKELESRLSALEAEIIWRAPTLEEARRIYDGVRAAPQMRQQVKGNGF